MTRSRMHHHPARLVAGALCVALLGAVPAASQEEVRFTFEGRGFGHGVGMSQYGARGAALQGWSAPRILAWYYRGSSITSGGAADVRVQVAAARTEVTVAADGGGTLVDPVDNERIPLASGVSYTARMGPRGLTITDPDGREVDVAVRAVRIAPAEGGLVRLSDRRFRGTLDVIADGATVSVVNTLDIESYLRGVLSGEMPASWGDATPAALRAQAIAARSYAITSLRPTAAFDLYADVRSQMYLGVAGEDPRTDAAVAATTRQVLTSGGTVIRAYYSSTSGGHTENVENSLGGSPVPYLVGVPDPYDDVSPLHRWANPPVFTATRLATLLRVPAPVTGFAVTKRGVSPRVMTARVTSADGTVTDLSGLTVKSRLGLRDTWFWVARSDRPAPAEPPVAGVTTPPPVTTTPPPATSQAPRVGDFLVVASRQRTLADARAVRGLVATARPTARVLARGSGRTRVYLVVTARTRSRVAADRERQALRVLGYAALLARAVKGDPVVRLVTRTPATASQRFRVVAAVRPTLAGARVVVRGLRRIGRQPLVLRPRAGRYLVVTLRGVPRARAVLEARALARAGYPARIQVSS